LYMALKVAKAAAVPLPDDDEEPEAVDATAASPAAAVSAPVSDARPLGVTSKSAPSGSTKRVAFAETPQPVQAEKHKAWDATLKVSSFLS
jgi:hypothetical protein